MVNTVQTVRIEGVILPPNAHIVIGLQSIYGIGLTRAQNICAKVNIAGSKKVKDLEDAEIRNIQLAVAEYETEGNLRRKRTMDIKRLRDIRCYRGIRHSRRLPVNGQRTHTNARTAKGVAGKKGTAKK